MKIFPIAVAAALMLTSIAGAAVALAATEIRIVSSSGLKEVMLDLAPEFERTTGHKLVMEFDSSAGVKRKVEAGANFDIVFVTPPMIADLARQGKLAPGSGTEIARVGLGAAIRAGAPRPDIGTTEAFRQTLLNAKSIMHNKEGQSGIYMSALLERLGIAEQIRPRIILKTVAGPVAENIARGEAELGFQLISEIVTVKGAELLGPLPSALQTFVVFAAAFAAGMRDPAAANELLRFLATPTSAQVMKKYGMESLAR